MELVWGVSRLDFAMTPRQGSPLDPSSAAFEEVRGILPSRTGPLGWIRSWRLKGEMVGVGFRSMN